MPKRTRTLTARQHEIFVFIEGYIHEKGYPPVIREIAAAFGFREKAAHDHLIAMEKKGYISRKAECARSLVILKPSGNFLKQQIYRCGHAIPCVDIQKGDYVHISSATGEIVGLTRLLEGGC